MAVAVLLTTFCVPTKFVGMGHYVQQIYLIPLFVALGLAIRWRGIMRFRVGVYAVVCGYAVMLCLPQLKFIPYVWLTSVQNLQILDEVQSEECPLIESRNYYGQYLWRHDAACKVKIVGPGELGDVSGWHSYGAAARRYNYWRKTEMPTSFYDFSFNDAGYDQVKRRKGAGTYFVRKFLPGELRHGYKRFGQWFSLRCRQLRTAWVGG